LTKHLKDVRTDSFRISEHLIVPESKHAEVLRLEPSRSDLVAVLRQCVLAAVDLEYEPLGEADKIDDIRTERDLAPKAIPRKLLAAQERPELSLGIGWSTPQIARDRARHKPPKT